MKPGIAVIGTVFVDHKGFAGPGYRADGRNLGQIKTVAGGVARNVAVNLSCLAMPTWFVGTVDTDSASGQFVQEMHRRGVALDYLKTVSPAGTGCWLAILAHDGALLGSVSQMPDLARMEEEIVPLLGEVLSKVKGIALEIDLSISLVRAIIRAAKQANCKIYALPGNLSVIGAYSELFKDMECFICNDTEAEILMDIQQFDDLQQVLSQMRTFAQKHGLKNLVVTLGRNGAVYIDEYGDSGHQMAIPVKVVDTTGAGDAFFSGTVAALMHHKTLPQAVASGAQVASGVVSVAHSDCSVLGEEQLKLYQMALS